MASLVREKVGYPWARGPCARLDKVEVAELAPADLVLQPRLRPRVEPTHGVHHLHLFFIRLGQLLGIAHLLPFLHRPVVLVSLREALVALLRLEGLLEVLYAARACSGVGVGVRSEGS